MWRNKLFNKIIRVLLSLIVIPCSFIGLLFWIGIFSKDSKSMNTNSNLATNSDNSNYKLANNSENSEKDTDKGEENSNDEDIQNKNINNYMFGEPEFLELYLKQNKIEKINFSEEKKLTQMEEKLKDIDINSSEFKCLDANLTKKNTLEEGFNQYKLTLSKTNVMYLGGLKNNKPDGIGIIVEVIEYGDRKILSKKYIGNFKNGYFDGYGKLYYVPLQDDYGNLVIVKKYSEKDPNYINKRLNGLMYEGKFQDGTIIGEGNEFEYLNLELEFSYRDELNGDIIRQSEIYKLKEDESKKEELETLSKSIEEGFRILNNPITVFCGTYKNGQLNGKGKIYRFGKLYYDGEWKDNQWDGKGTMYFENSNSIRYKGEIKEGKANGKGILYDKDENIIYSGKWKDGNYE